MSNEFKIVTKDDQKTFAAMTNSPGSRVIQYVGIGLDNPDTGIGAIDLYANPHVNKQGTTLRLDPRNQNLSRTYIISPQKPKEVAEENQLRELLLPHYLFSIENQKSSESVFVHPHGGTLYVSKPQGVRAGLEHAFTELSEQMNISQGNREISNDDVQKMLWFAIEELAMF